MADGIWQDGGEADLWPGAEVEVDGVVARGADGSVWISDEGVTDSSDPVLTGAGPITDGTVTWTRVADWPVSTAVAAGARRQATTPDGHLRTAANDFTTGGTEPTWVTDGSTNIDGVAAPTGGGFGDSAREIGVWFDIWHRSDLRGDAIGTLVRARAQTYRDVHDQMGQGSFIINRHDDDDLDLCEPWNLVRVRIDPDGPFAFDDPRYKGAFFIERGTDQLLEAEDEGAEDIKFSGGGAELLLRRAIIDWEAHHPFNQLSGREFDRTVTKDRQWHIKASEFVLPSIGTPGSVMRSFLRDCEAMASNPIPILSAYPTGHDFNVDHDSLGVLWSDGATDWSFDVGATLLDVLNTLLNSGFHYRMMPSLVLHAYENEQGVDRSATVTLAEQVNVADAGTREIEAGLLASRVLVGGDLEDNRAKYRWATELDSELHNDDLAGGDIEADIGVQHAFLAYPASPTASRLAKAGKTFLNKAYNQRKGPPTIGVLSSEGMVPFIDYYPGDFVGVDIPEFGDPTRIHAMTLRQRDTNGSCDFIVEFLEDPQQVINETLGEALPATGAEGGASRGLTTSPEDKTVSLGEGEMLHLIWFPAAGAMLVDGSPPDQITDSGMGYVNGPGTFVLSMADADAIFMWVIVNGAGTTVSGG
jgi:hypothetical protein